MMHLDEEVRSLASTAQLDEATRAAMAALPLMISTDSHVQEPDEVWTELPPRLYDKFKVEMEGVVFRGGLPAGASDLRARLVDQVKDGIEAEVMFPNNGMAIFGFNDVETQVAAFKIYNDFIADFCKVSPKNLFGIPCISV